MSTDDRMLELDTRRSIFRHVEANPGLHLRGLQRALDMPLGTIEYHLHQMEKNGLLVSREDGRFKAFFVSEGLDRRDKDILYYVRQEMPRQIIILLLLEPDSTHAKLVEKMPVSASTCSFHLKKLVKSGLVVEKRVGRSKHFDVADPERTANVMVRYRKSFLDDIVDRFARAWLDMGRGEAAAAEHDRATAGGEGEEETEATDEPSATKSGLDGHNDEAPSGAPTIEKETAEGDDPSEPRVAQGPLETTRRLCGHGAYWLGVVGLRFAQVAGTDDQDVSLPRCSSPGAA